MVQKKKKDSLKQANKSSQKTKLGSAIEWGIQTVGATI